MDPVAIGNLALLALQAVLNVIAELRSQGGLTDDQILAQAKTIAQGNDALYASLVATLTPPVPPATT